MSIKSVITQAGSFLESKGFNRKSSAWNRKRINFIEVIELQVSKAGDMVTINCGMFHPKVHAILWAAPAPEFVTAPFCAVTVRIGQLIDGKDLWWPLGEPGTPGEIADKLACFVLPFLGRMSSVEAMAQFLADMQVTKGHYPVPVVCLAILQYERGNKTEALDLLTELSNRLVGPWGARLHEIKGRLSG